CKLIIQGIKSIPNCEVIHLSSICYPPSLIFALWSILLKKKVIWSPRGEFAPEAVQNNKLKKILFSTIRFLFRKKVIFHATSNKELSEIKEVISPNKTVVLPNYMELPLPLPYDPSEKYLLYVGRINRIKAIHKLILALSQSDTFKNSDFKLKIAGDTTTFKDYYIELVQLISELGLSSKVEFLGRIDGEKKTQLYANAYFFFLVSESENFGNVVIEAMSQGTPVVTSYGTPWKELQGKRIGYHVENTPAILAKTIDEVLSISPLEYLQLRQKVKRYCTENYSIQTNVDKWIQVYKSVLL
ncbi:MAG: glycosyltransferase family 4 protein, partial [Muribaculaceae bacterium]|nr:glycosyltransferase family 4 protein [Muribaculaceae bacterium]